MPILPAPSSRSLVLYHGDLKRDMILIRQENNGKLYLSMDVANISELSDPGLLRCVRNTLHKPDLKGTYHLNLTNFLTRALLDIPQHDVATVPLGFFLQELYALGLVTDVPLDSINESMVLASSDTQRIHSVFLADGALIKVQLLTAPTPNLPSLVLQNDMPVKSQGELLKFITGAITEHFSLLDFFYDVDIRNVTTTLLTNKLSSLFLGGGAVATLLTATQIRQAGEGTSDISIPARGRIAQEEALKNMMNPPSVALQYRVTVALGRVTFVEPLKNRKEFVLQTDQDVYVGFGDDPAGGGFALPAGSVMGASLASNVAISLKPATADATIFILQLGV